MGYISPNAKVFNSDVLQNAKILDSAYIGNNVKLFDNVKIYNNANISGYLHILDNVEIFDNAAIKVENKSSDSVIIAESPNIIKNNVKIYGNSFIQILHLKISGNVLIYDDSRILSFKANILDNVKVFGKTNIVIHNLTLKGQAIIDSSDIKHSKNNIYNKTLTICGKARIKNVKIDV